MSIYDVIIIGGRVAGSAAAIELSKRGHKVLVLDQCPPAKDVISTHFVNPRGLSYLSELGVLDTLASDTSLFRHFDVEVDDIKLGGSLDVSTLDHRLRKTHPERSITIEERYACIRRPLLDGTLQAKAITHGAEVRLGVTLKDVVSFSGDHAVLMVSEGDKDYSVKGRFVIGADGRASRLANLLKVPKSEERFQCTFACYSYFEGLNLPNAIMRKRNRMTFAAAPTSFGKTMILVFGPKQFFPSFRSNIKANFFEAIKEIDPAFHQTLKDHGKRVEVFRTTVDQEAFIRQRPPFPFALIGDAASFKDQTTANGITSALRDALIISDELHLALSGEKAGELALVDYHSRHYLDLFHFYEFTATQAEANPLRPEEERLYRAISKNQSERDRFISLYFDSEEVKTFFNSRRIEALTTGESATPPRENDLRSRYKDPFSTKTPELHLEQSCFDYGPVSGVDMLKRTEPYLEFYRRREAAGTFQYSRTLHSFPGNTTRLSDEVGRMIDGINFASQDYLGLGQDPEIREAAIEALNRFGPHSAGSPMIIGNTLISKQLEEELKILTGKKHVLLFPTGYAAGIGSILGIVKSEDHIVMDRLSHACLQQGARAATRKIHKFAHLDADAARANLEAIRRTDTQNAILLITEGLFSMDADSPDLRKFQDLAHEFNATLFVDVAHDLGATGPGGQGQIGAQGMYGKIDLVMGSFSKTFASNGGFLATDSESLLHYLKMYSTPHLFSNALSPVQAGVALKATQIIQSSKGEMLRQKLMASVTELRRGLTNEGLNCYGNPSPIVPVFIGTERDARISHKKIVENNLAAMIIEYPVVPLGASRFRLQVMASHSIAEVQHAAKIIGNVMRQVRGEQITAREPHPAKIHTEIFEARHELRHLATS